MSTFFLTDGGIIAKQKQNWHNLSNNPTPPPPQFSRHKEELIRQMMNGHIQFKGLAILQPERGLTPIDRSH